MKCISSFIVALFLSFNIFAAAADTPKIAVVDLQKVMRSSSQMKSIQTKLEAEYKPRRDKLVAMEAKLKGDMEQFKRDASILSDTQKKEMEKKIVSAQQTFEREGQRYQQELSAAHNEAMENLYTKIRAAITEVAKKENFDLILQKDAAPFSTTKLDVTDLVVKQIGG